MANGQGYQLALKFPDASENFSHGFACGIIWQKLKSDESEFSETILEANREFIETMCCVTGWTEDIENIGDGWLYVTFRRNDNG